MFAQQKAWLFAPAVTREIRTYKADCFISIGKYLYKVNIHCAIAQ